MAAFTAEQRTREIGVRKVHGATVTTIVLILSKEYTKLVALANLIAWPVMYFAMDRWLENFAYRIDLAWTSFPLAGGLALLIALITVSYQSVKAAITNPVDALKYE
jgi:putative ABC transport system permease protein